MPTKSRSSTLIAVSMGGIINVPLLVVLEEGTLEKYQAMQKGIIVIPKSIKIVIRFFCC
jgi:hypothetical protein